MQHIITDGVKSLNINSLPPEAWTIIRGGEGDTKTSKLFGAVAYYFACADTRIQTVGNMPYEIVRGDTVVLSSDQNEPPLRGLEWLADIPALFPLIEAGKILTGQAYLFNERTTLSTRGLRWWLPHSVKPIISSDMGLTGFERRLGGSQKRFDVDDVLYFWPPDPFVEIGPARNYPGKAAVIPGMALESMDTFITEYFDRGLVKATLLSYADRMTAEESREVKDWWGRVTAGVTRAFSQLVVRGDFKATIIGEGLKDLSDKTLTENEKENIAVAFRVPMSMVFKKPGGLGDGTDNDERAFIERVIGPSCNHTAACFNKQFFAPMGLHLRFLPDKLSVMQEDEASRSGALLNLVNAGIPADIATRELGYKFNDEDIARIQSASMVAVQPPLPETATDAGKTFEDAALVAIADAKAAFRRWYKKRDNPDVTQFKNDLLTHGDKLALVDEMEGASGKDAPFRYP